MLFFGLVLHVFVVCFCFHVQFCVGSLKHLPAYSTVTFDTLYCVVVCVLRCCVCIVLLCVCIVLFVCIE